MQTYVLGIDVGTGGNRNSQSTRKGAASGRADFLRWVFRTNARGGDARRPRRCGSAGADLVRRAYGETMPRADRARWSRAVDPPDLQSSPCEFHGHKTVMDTRERTGKLETSAFSLASEGLRSILPDRTKSHGCRRCFRDPSAECNPASVVYRSSAGGRNRSVVAASAVRVRGSLRES